MAQACVAPVSVGAPERHNRRLAIAPALGDRTDSAPLARPAFLRAQGRALLAPKRSRGRPGASGGVAQPISGHPQDADPLEIRIWNLPLSTIRLKAAGVAPALRLNVRLSNLYAACMQPAVRPLTAATPFSPLPP